MSARDPWTMWSDSVHAGYDGHLGQPVQELVTPALIVDLTLLEANIETMNRALTGRRAVLRPHTKVQKSPDLARLQLESGARGITVATVWEAAAMALAGINDILVANEVVGHAKIDALAAVAATVDLTVAVDDVDNIGQIDSALGAHGARARALVDLDVGMGRCGARSPEEALRIARAVAASSHLFLAGVQAYEGHCMHEPDRQARERMALEAMSYAASVRALIEQDGLDAPTLSGGGTGTYEFTGTNPDVTELQAGSYVFMDAFHGNLVPDFEKSLFVLTTVMARHGDTVIFDCGRKSIGIDFVSPPIAGQPYEARYYAEEHALFDTGPEFAAYPGDIHQLVPGYAPTTVNLHDVMFVTRDDVVVDVWPVFPRGPQHHGLR